jgi:hypothetical protein
MHTGRQNAMRQECNIVHSDVGTLDDLRPGRAAPDPITGPHHARSPSRKACGSNLQENSQNNIHDERSAAANSGNVMHEATKRSAEQERKATLNVQQAHNIIVERLGFGNVEEGWRLFMELDDLQQRTLTAGQLASEFTDEMVKTYREIAQAKTVGGVDARPGFYMPSLFPPRGEDQDLDGAA